MRVWLGISPTLVFLAARAQRVLCSAQRGDRPGAVAALELHPGSSKVLDVSGAARFLRRRGADDANEKTECCDRRRQSSHAAKVEQATCRQLEAGSPSEYSLRPAVDARQLGSAA